MAKTKNKGNLNYDRMTKAQLRELLIEMQNHVTRRDKEHRQIQEKLKEKTEQVKQLHKELGEFRSARQRINKLQKTLIENLKTAQVESNSRIKDLERMAFRIEIYLRQLGFHVKIVDLLTTDKKNFEGIDGAAISEFILEQLSKLRIRSDEENVAHLIHPKPEFDDLNKEKSVSAAVISSVSSIPEADLTAEVFEKINILQKKRFLIEGEPLGAHMPFAVHTHFNLPVIPTEDNVDIDTTAYDVRAIVMDNREKEVIAGNGSAEILEPGVTHYESKIDMGGLGPGKYLIKLCVLAPFAKIEAIKQVELTVEP